MIGRQCTLAVVKNKTKQKKASPSLELRQSCNLHVDWEASQPVLFLPLSVIRGSHRDVCFWCLCYFKGQGRLDLAGGSDGPSGQPACWRACWVNKVVAACHCRCWGNRQHSSGFLQECCSTFAFIKQLLCTDTLLLWKTISVGIPQTEASPAAITLLCLSKRSVSRFHLTASSWDSSVSSSSGAQRGWETGWGGPYMQIDLTYRRDTESESERETAEEREVQRTFVVELQKHYGNLGGSPFISLSSSLHSSLPSHLIGCLWNIKQHMFHTAPTRTLHPSPCIALQVYFWVFLALLQHFHFPKFFFRPKCSNPTHLTIRFRIFFYFFNRHLLPVFPFCPFFPTVTMTTKQNNKQLLCR